MEVNYLNYIACAFFSSFSLFSRFSLEFLGNVSFFFFCKNFSLSLYLHHFNYFFSGLLTNRPCHLIQLQQTSNNSQTIRTMWCIEIVKRANGNLIESRFRRRHRRHCCNFYTFIAWLPIARFWFDYITESIVFFFSLSIFDLTQ